MAPASSQDADVFTITPTEGTPGTTVFTELDPAAIDDSACYLTPEDVQGEEGPLAQLASDMGAATAAAGFEEGSDRATAAGTLQIIISVLAGDPARAASVEQLLSNFFVLTFVDIGTMEPVGERSTFDPETGDGKITVPELDPGLWAVAATCVFPVVDDPAAWVAAVDGAVAALRAYPELLNDDGNLDGATILLTLLGVINPGLGDVIGEAALSGALPLLAAPRDRWTHPFTIPAALPEPDPEVAAFCAAIPQLPGLAEQLITVLAGLPADDGTMTPEEWAAAADWAAIGTQLSGLVDDIEALLLEGDTVRPEALADEWARATAPLRQLRDALQAVDYDLSTESGRMIAGQLRDQATAEGEGEGGDSAADVLTEWFLNHCLPEAPVDPPAAAPAAQPRGAQPRYTG